MGLSLVIAHPGTPGASRDDQQRRRVAELRQRSWAGVDSLIARGAARYRRERDLPRLLPRQFFGKFPGLHDSAAIVAILRQAMQQERKLGEAGHRSYNLNRHMALAEALKAELEHPPT